MGEKTMWRLFEFRLFEKTEYMLSDRPMTDAEVDEVFSRAQFDFDLEDLGVGLYYGANIALSCYSSDRKEHCEAIKEECEKGNRSIIAGLLE